MRAAHGEQAAGGVGAGKSAFATGELRRLAAVEADDIAQLHSFANGIDRDLDAVSLTLLHSSGAAESNVTRVKALKRSRYGRANFGLPRKIILWSY
jgi:transposase